MNSMAIMTMFERHPEVATPIIDGETAASDGDNSSARWHTIDQTKSNMNQIKEYKLSKHTTLLS
jgi:hypothetical protein